MCNQCAFPCTSIPRTESPRFRASLDLVLRVLRTVTCCIHSRRARLSLHCVQRQAVAGMAVMAQAAPPLRSAGSFAFQWSRPAAKEVFSATCVLTLGIVGK